ncbi:hypothetical protein Msi02_74530 [Microbispora siamensis]|uniref:MFS transporter n=1 Tax=Microbispora siamensis TaxID=564413 RepID=A0ABQ4GYX1_9ACTN|nr:hypothetical protein Msi02_74530 [Microbispora siamensis]
MRTFLRMGAEAVAPVTFGFLADVLGSGGATSARGLQYTFLIMLAPLMANAIILLHGRHSYPRDVRRPPPPRSLACGNPSRQDSAVRA